MQTTKNSNDSPHFLTMRSAQVEAHHAPQHEPKPKQDKYEFFDAAAIIQELVREEADLRWRADELMAQAHELDCGDDESQHQADRLRSRRSDELRLADEIKCVASELKADPSKKVARMKASTLTVQANHSIGEGEEEVESSSSVRGASSDHKVIIHHAVVHEAKAEAKKEKHEVAAPVRKKPAAKKPATVGGAKVEAPKQQHAAPKPQQPPAPTRMWGLGLPAAAATPLAYHAYSPWPQVPAFNLAPPPAPEVPWNGIGLFGFQSLQAPLQAAALPGPVAANKVISGQVVAAVKNVPIPPSIGPLVSLSPNAALTPSAAPSFFAAPWNQFPPIPTHS